MKSILNAIGSKFNKLTIVRHVKDRKVECTCDCGNTKIVDYFDVKRGFVKACGCMRNLPEQRKNAKTRVIEMRAKGVFKPGGDYQSDALSPFRYTWKCISNKNTGRKPIAITIGDLSTIWKRQSGICPYSGIHLILPTHSNVKIHPQYMYASLDRIDSTKGYTTDNIQFVCKSLNYAKNSMSEIEFLQFLDILRGKSGGEGTHDPKLSL